MSKISNTEQKEEASRVIKIRQFKEKDLPAVYQLIQKTIDFSYSGVYPEEAIEFFKEHHNKDNILNDAVDGYTIVAEVNGEIAGTGTLFQANSRRVFVEPPHPRRGVGVLITRELEKEATHKKLSYIELQASLVSTQFWESQGYIVQEDKYIPVKNNQKLRFYEMVKTLNAKT
jgi:N-acetylglutamate synthase-like GNAT family acetyltransferase